MFSALLSVALAAQTTPSAQPEVAAASQWVSLIDRGSWNDSWAASGTLFRSRMPEANWPSAIAPFRDQLGPVRTRVLKANTKAKSLPGAPDGDYQIVEFTTSFEKKADATETVVLCREAADWKVVGYFIN